MGAQRLPGSQSRLNFTGVINRGGKWNQDALDAHDLRAPAAPPFATTGGVIFADCGRRCRPAVPGQRDVAQYHVINNVGIAVEFLARMSGPGHFSDVGRCQLESAKWAKADIDQVAVTSSTRALARSS